MSIEMDNRLRALEARYAELALLVSTATTRLEALENKPVTNSGSTDGKKTKRG